MYEWKVVHATKNVDHEIATELQRNLNQLDADGFEIVAVHFNRDGHPFIVARKKKGGA
jgi:hypothetical protein